MIPTIADQIRAAAAYLHTPPPWACGQPNKRDIVRATGESMDHRRLAVLELLDAGGELWARQIIDGLPSATKGGVYHLLKSMLSTGDVATRLVKAVERGPRLKWRITDKGRSLRAHLARDQQPNTTSRNQEH